MEIVLGVEKHPVNFSLCSWSRQSVSTLLFSYQQNTGVLQAVGNGKLLSDIGVGVPDRNVQCH